MNQFCVVGAGIAGITFAKAHPSSLILEKSRGIGGRIAARRLGAYSIDHGPLEIRLNADHTILEPHSWIKGEAQGLKILQSWEASQLQLSSQSIQIESKDGATEVCQKLIITAPAPQARVLLESTGLAADFLAHVQYRPAIQLMLLSASSLDLSALNEHFELRAKKLPAADLCLNLFEMRPHFTSEFLGSEREHIQSHFLDMLPAGVLFAHAHKWRYSEVSQPISPEYQMSFARQNIFLAGDYFGSHGVESSVESAKRLIEKIK